MPDIILEIAMGLYFYMRDDKRIGLAFKCECGKDCYLAFTVAHLTELLGRVVGRLTADNAQGQYYLTDAIGILAARGERVEAVALRSARNGMGVDTAEDLAQAQRIWQVGEAL